MGLGNAAFNSRSAGWKQSVDRPVFLAPLYPFGLSGPDGRGVETIFARGESAESFVDDLISVGVL